MTYEQLREVLYALGGVAPSTGWHYLSVCAVACAARTAWHQAPEAGRHAIGHAFVDATGHPDGISALMLDSIRLLCLRH
jgi:hypothetical protein